MPNRIIKESICTNEQIDQLSPFEETFFYRLIVNVDDYGRMDGRPSILRARLFPLKTLRDDQIEKAIRTLSTVELVHRYTVHGKPFVSLTGWDRNQSIRAKKSKYPSPDEADECNPSHASEINCMHLHADVPVIQSESESESNPNTKGNARATRFTPPTVDDVKAYCSEQGYAVDPQRFVDYYASNGWMVGKNRMKDWKATVRTWESREKSGTSSNPALNYDESAHYKKDQSGRCFDVLKHYGAKPNPALNYTQRSSEETNYNSTFINLLDEYGKEDTNA